MPIDDSPWRGFCLFDLDGTLVPGRTIERLARRFGLEADIAHALGSGGEPAAGIGETKRVLALFEGQDAAAFRAACQDGGPKRAAVDVVAALHARSIMTGIATATYVDAAWPVARSLQIPRVAAVEPVVVDGRLSGTTKPLLWSGPCGHAVCKARVLNAWAGEAGARWTCAVGDGDNDVCMFRAADLAVAIEPATVAATAAADVVLSDLADLPLVIEHYDATRG